MKKTILFVLLLAIALQSNFAQNLDNLITDFLQKENANYQLIDKDMILSSIEATINSTSANEEGASMPAFMNKLEAIEILDLSACDQETKTEFNTLFDNIEDENGYTTLVSDDDDGGDKARIMIKKDGDQITQILIIGINSEDNEIAILKMSGTLDQTDIDDILKQEQNKNKN